MTRFAEWNTSSLGVVFHNLSRFLGTVFVMVALLHQTMISLMILRLLELGVVPLAVPSTASWSKDMCPFCCMVAIVGV